MTQAQYKAAYQQARKEYPTLTRKAMIRLRKIYIDSAKQVAEKVASAELAGQSAITINSMKQIERQLQDAAANISEALSAEVKTTSKTAIDLTGKIDSEYLVDIFDGSQKITEAGIKNMYASINDKVMRSIISRVYRDGYSFSERVWKTGKYFESQIKNVMSAGFAQGRSTVQVARDIQKYVRDGKISLVNSYGTLKRGTREFTNRIGNRIDSRALRLVRSEMYQSLQDASRETGRANPGATDKFEWVLELGRQHWDCDCLSNAERGPYDYGSVPDYPHANCRCTVRPILRDQNEFRSDLKAWLNGEKKSYLDEWYKMDYKGA